MSLKVDKKVYDGAGSNKKVAKHVILGCGNPLLDISAKVPTSMFEKYDVKPGSAILAEGKQLEIYEELVNTYEVNYVAGGATQNSIRVAQWILQSPGATSFIGSVGKDKFAETLKQSCKDAGVSSFYYETEESGTGVCAVLVEESGERALVTNLEAANCYKHAHTQSVPIQDLISEAQVFYISSFFSTVPEGPETMTSIAKHAAENNKCFCINLSAEFLIDFFWDKMSAIIPFTDFIFSNEVEAAKFAQKQNWECGIEETALRLSSFSKVSGARCRTVVFTQGADPTVVAHNGKVTLYPVPTLAKEALIDTNGAGDAFVGGFLARLAQGCDLTECVRTGHYAARVVIQQSGCVFPPQPDV